MGLRRAELFPKQSFFWSSAGRSELPERLRLFTESTLERDETYIALQKSLAEETKSDFWPLLLGGGDFGVATGIVEIRYIEEILPVEEKVYVMGPLRQNRIEGKHCIVAAESKSKVNQVLLERERFYFFSFALALVSAIGFGVFFTYAVRTFGR